MKITVMLFFLVFKGISESKAAGKKSAYSKTLYLIRMPKCYRIHQTTFEIQVKVRYFQVLQNTVCDWPYFLK